MYINIWNLNFQRHGCPSCTIILNYKNKLVRYKLEQLKVSYLIGFCTFMAPRQPPDIARYHFITVTFLRLKNDYVYLCVTVCRI